MSLFIAGMIAGAALITAFLVAKSVQFRAKSHRHSLNVRSDENLIDRPTSSGSDRRITPSETNDSAVSRAAAYREILDALGDDLDDDIAEWEAVLQDFPQVIGAEELQSAGDASPEAMLGTARDSSTADALPMREQITPLQRTRRVSADERGMIQRLMRTGFAAEEIALWLNLPLERVQEFLIRD